MASNEGNGLPRVHRIARVLAPPRRGAATRPESRTVSSRQSLQEPALPRLTPSWFRIFAALVSGPKFGPELRDIAGGRDDSFFDSIERAIKLGFVEKERAYGLDRRKEGKRNRPLYMCQYSLTRSGSQAFENAFAYYSAWYERSRTPGAPQMPDRIVVSVEPASDGPFVPERGPDDAERAKLLEGAQPYLRLFLRAVWAGLLAKEICPLNYGDWPSHMRSVPGRGKRRPATIRITGALRSVLDEAARSRDRGRVFNSVGGERWRDVLWSKEFVRARQRAGVGPEITFLLGDQARRSALAILKCLDSKIGFSANEIREKTGRADRCPASIHQDLKRLCRAGLIVRARARRLVDRIGRQPLFEYRITQQGRKVREAASPPDKELDAKIQGCAEPAFRLFYRAVRACPRGLRLDDLRDLTWPQVDLEAGTVQGAPVADDEFVRVLKDAREALDGSPLFLNAFAGRCQVSSIERAFKLLRNGLGIDERVKLMPRLRGTRIGAKAKHQLIGMRHMAPLNERNRMVSAEAAPRRERCRQLAAEVRAKTGISSVRSLAAIVANRTGWRSETVRGYLRDLGREDGKSSKQNG
jgi:hypothetical protein